MHFMQAHGLSAGPAQRPGLTGFLSAVLAMVPAGVVMQYSGALAGLAAIFHTRTAGAIALYAVVFSAAGILYGTIFRRAANDRAGGWLFGLSYGFLLWVLGPATAIQFLRAPAIVGYAAIGLLCANLLFGLFLGLVFPWVHCLTRSSLEKAFERDATSRRQVDSQR
jgi:hypothetical protein